MVAKDLLSIVSSRAIDFPVLDPSDKEQWLEFLEKDGPVLINNAHGIDWKWDQISSAYQGTFIDVVVSADGHHSINDQPEFHKFANEDPRDPDTDVVAVRRRISIDEFIRRVTDPEQCSPLLSKGEKLCHYGYRLPIPLRDDAQPPEQLEAFSDKLLHLSQEGMISSPRYELASAAMAQIAGERRVLVFPADTDLYEFPLGSAMEQESRVFRLRGADPAMFPNVANSKCWDGTLKPGDVLFLPSLSWYYLEALSPSIGITYYNHDNMNSQAIDLARSLLGSQAALWSMSSNSRSAFTARIRRLLDSSELNLIDPNDELQSLEPKVVQTEDGFYLEYDNGHEFEFEGRWCDFGSGLAKHRTFRAIDATKWGIGYSWDDVSEYLNTLNRLGVLRRR